MSSTLSLVTFGAAVVLYGAASTLFYVEIARPAAKRERRKIAPVLLAGGAAAHLVYVALASFVAHVCPVHSVHFILSIASLITSCVYLAARLRLRIHALGLIVAPLGLVVTLGTYFLGVVGSEERLSASFIGLHVFANLVGAALFLLASGAAVMYLLQERRLKNKKALMRGETGRLPPLDSLDKASHRFLMAGFPLLTLGVATGTIWAKTLEAGWSPELLRALLGYAMWLLIAAVLLLRVVVGWRGRRAAYGTVAGFLCAALVLMFYIVRAAGGGMP